MTALDGSVDLTLKPFAVHREQRDLKIVKSRFMQPLGLWHGTVSAGGATYQVRNLPGVAEDQDVLW